MGGGAAAGGGPELRYAKSTLSTLLKKSRAVAFCCHRFYSSFSGEQPFPPCPPPSPGDLLG